jgi:hypothetical protein
MGRLFSVLLVAMALSANSQVAYAEVKPVDLKISAFKDITAFILDQMSRRHSIVLDVSYVKDASQAHEDLITQRADLVFMSYDDTLSIALEDNHRDIVAVMPVHGGILDLCGDIDIAIGKVNIGIDTDTGYTCARV